MRLAWEQDEAPRWDAEKLRIIGGVPGAFSAPFAIGDALPGEWWRVVDEGVGHPRTTVAFGRLDISWGGDAEVLLAVDPARHEQGIGAFVLAHLEQEAADRGINYVYNTIRAHASRDLVHDWLVVRGFRGPVDGDLRKRVGSPITPSRSQPRPRVDYHPAADERGQGPGDEGQGGYVDVERHRY